MTAIFVRLQVPGFHAWPGAPDRRSYLRTRHRHLFHIEAQVGVGRNASREIEFHDLLDFLREQLALTAPPGRAQCLALDGRVAVTESGIEFGTYSCEQIARILCDALAARFGDDRATAVRVSEDGEVGAVVDNAEEACG